MTQIHNCPFPPVNWTTWLNYWKPQGKWLGISKSHINTTKHTLVALTVYHPSTDYYNTTHSDKHKCKSCNTNDEVNEIIGQTHTPKNAISEHEDIKDPHDSDSPDSNLHSSSDSEWLSRSEEIIR